MQAVMSQVFLAVLPALSPLIAVLLVNSAAAHVFLPPHPPIACNVSSGSCTVQSFQGSWPDGGPCKAAMATFPTSEAELIQAVALASKTRSKVRVVSRGSHSFNKLVCPGGDKGILISTQNYNSYVRVNLTSRTVTADAGVLLKELIDKVAQYGLTLPHTPFYGGVSVAGMISTGAHGSGMWGKGCAPHDYVVGIRLIIAATEEEGYAKAVDVTEGDNDLDAARLSLGVLGAISRVTFQLEPMFKRSASVETREDERLEEELLEFGHRHEFGSLVWYPSLRKVLLKMEDRVPAETPGNGALKSPMLDKMEVGALELIFTNWASIEERRDIGKFCLESQKALESQQCFGNGLLNNIGGTFTGYPVVGFNHNMQTSSQCEGDTVEYLPARVTATSIVSYAPTTEHEDEYEYSHNDFAMPLDSKFFTCGWNPLYNPFFGYDISISIPISHIKEAILEIKKLRGFNPRFMCKLEFSGGIFMRFLGPSTAYLGEGGKSVMLELFFYTLKAAPQTPMLHGDIVEEIEQMLVSKFKGKPHWGKNRKIAFQNVHMLTPNMDKFLEARERFDPMGLFSNEWSDVILGIDSSSITHLHQGHPFQKFHEHCGVEGLCVCTNDSHCNPSKNYYCRRGHIYDQARVCRYEGPEFQDESPLI